MRHTLRLILGMLSLILLVSCGVDPRKEAEAYRIRTEANQQAADDQLAREQVQDLHDAEMQRLADEQARRDAIQQNRIAAAKWVWTSVKISASLSAFILILALGVSLSRMSYGLATVAVDAASLRANLIPLDQVTRQFPLLRQVHGTRYALSNPNTGSVIMLDTSRDEDRQMIAAMGMTQLAGAVAHEARQSDDPAGLAMLTPKTVHAQQDGLFIGDTYIADAIPLPEKIKS